MHGEEGAPPFTALGTQGLQAAWVGFTPTQLTWRAQRGPLGHVSVTLLRVSFLPGLQQVGVGTREGCR